MAVDRESCQCIRRLLSADSRRGLFFGNPADVFGYQDCGHGGCSRPTIQLASVLVTNGTQLHLLPFPQRLCGSSHELQSLARRKGYAVGLLWQGYGGFSSLIGSLTTTFV